MRRAWRFLISGGCALLLAIGIGRFTHMYQNIASCISYPAVRANAWMVEPVKQWLSRRKNTDNFLQQLLELQEQYALLERSYAQLQAKVSYFEGIKEVREFSQRFEKTDKIARVLARTFSPDEHFFYIDAGQKDNVTKDTIVLHNGGLVGKVSEVYPWYSKVCLITDARCKVGAYCADTRAQGIHEGCNQEGQTCMQFVDHLSKVTQGDLVLSSGQGMLFPEGFTIGTVSSVAPDGLYQNVCVTPACDLQRIDYCVLMTKADA